MTNDSQSESGGVVSSTAWLGDRLRMDYINSLPQPFIAKFWGGDEWPIYDIEVQTGLLRIDVCGKLQVKHIADVRLFRDAEGIEHDSETFYSDYESPNDQAHRRRAKNV